MEDNFKQNDFEEFLQDQVRNHRMYPGDAVWREIDKKLHGEKQWPALTVAASILLSLTVLICVYFTPKPNIFSIQPANGNTSTPQISQKSNSLNNLTSSVPFAKDEAASAYGITNRLPNFKTVSADSSDTNLKQPILSNITTDERSVGNIAVPISPSSTHVRNFATVRIPNVATAIPHPTTATVGDTLNSTIDNTQAIASAPAGLDKDKRLGTQKTKAAGETSSGKEYNDKNMADNFLKDHKEDIPLHTASKKTSGKNKFSYQLYFAPSVSYRKLLEDNSMVKANNGGPVGLNYVTDVNKVVRHKPGTGIETGIAFMYNLSGKVRIKSGFQFNVRQYSIEAYRSNTELASIALIGSNRIDTINTLAIYRNNNGYYSAELVNRYYQLSTPVGIEWEIIGNKEVQLNVSGTIQPTYLLNRNAYLLSTNFKNYTESPGMVRQWNINSNIEAFVSFKVGDFKWQFGPQLRYQPYSTFIPQYPIKEHLMDYGIKLGVSKTLH